MKIFLKSGINCESKVHARVGQSQAKLSQKQGMERSGEVCSGCGGVLTLETVPWYARSGSVSAQIISFRERIPGGEAILERVGIDFGLA